MTKTKKWTTEIKKRVAELKISKKGTTKTKKMVIIQGDDHQEGDD
jgi:hypothetical protein